MCFNERVTLAVWAGSFGVYPWTAYRWLREDRMPVSARRLPSETIVVDLPDSRDEGRAVVYVRVSSDDQRTELAAQAGRGDRLLRPAAGLWWSTRRRPPMILCGTWWRC